MDNMFFKSFHIAGFSYYQGAFLFGDMSIGSTIEVHLDKGNPADENAVELRYKEQKIGYIPQNENYEIAAMLKAGYEIFNAVVQQLSPEKHPEQQVRIGLFITVDKRKKK